MLLVQVAHANPRSSTIAVSPVGDIIAIVNSDSRSITLVELPSHEVRSEIIVGRDPRNVAFNDKGDRVFVTNRWDDSLSIIDVATSLVEKTVELCDEPVGVLPLHENRVFVTCQGASTIAVVDPDEGIVTDIVEAAKAPRGMAFDRSRNLLYVTHFLDGRISVIEPETLQVLNTISTGTDSSLVNGITISPDGDKAWVPHERSNVGNEALLFDTTVFPVVTAIDLNQQAQVFSARIHLDITDQPVNMPFDAVMTTENVLWVLNSGSNDISVIDLAENTGIAHVDVGDNPRGLALSQDEKTIYVNNNLSGTMSVIDTGTLLVTDEIQVTEIALTASILNGKRLFHSADRTDLARDQWVSCATCHFDGEMDARTWFFPDGPRNTTSLLGVAETLPVHWSGDLDELQDVEITIRGIQAGTGLAEGDDNCEPACDQAEPNKGRSQNLDDLAEYMSNLEFSDNPHRRLDGSLSEAAERGKALFNSEITGCAGCHAAPLYTDRLQHDVGTGQSTKERKGSEFDTPSLRGIYKTAPYLHDGSAATLIDVLTVHNPVDQHGTTSSLSPEELGDLVSFLQSLGGEDSGFVINPGLNDAWYESGKPGQGIFLTVFPKQKVVFLAWFTFDTEPQSGSNPVLGNAGQRWLTAQGPFERNRAELELFVSKNGVFDSDESEVKTEPYGTVTLEFTSCTSGAITYRIPSLEREGVIPLERIVSDNVAFCESLAIAD